MNNKHLDVLNIFQGFTYKGFIVHKKNDFIICQSYVTQLILFNVNPSPPLSRFCVVQRLNMIYRL